MKQDFIDKIGAGDRLRKPEVGQRVVFAPPYNTVLQAVGKHGVITNVGPWSFRVKFDEPVRWIYHGGYYREGSYEIEYAFHFRQETRKG